MNKTVDEYMAMPYTIKAEMARDSDGALIDCVAWVDELPGCITQVKHLMELRRMMTDAMRAWIETAIDQGIPIPEPQKVKDE